MRVIGLTRTAWCGDGAVYLYKPAELEEIARAAGALNGKAGRDRGDYSATNGMPLKEMLLEDWHPPDRDILIEQLEQRRAKTKQLGRAA